MHGCILLVWFLAHRKQNTNIETQESMERDVVSRGRYKRFIFLNVLDAVVTKAKFKSVV